MKTQEASEETHVKNINAGLEKQAPKITWQFGEAVEVYRDKNEVVDFTLPILNSTIQRKITL